MLGDHKICDCVKNAIVCPCLFTLLKLETSIVIDWVSHFGIDYNTLVGSIGISAVSILVR